MKKSVRRALKKYDPRWKFFYGLPDRGRILELGCGSGGNCSALKEIHPDLEIHGLDILKKLPIPEIVQYEQCNLEAGTLPYPDDHFHAILFIHVIEHLKTPTRLCTEIYRILKSEGRIYIETPNYTSVFVPSIGFRRDQHHPFNFFDDMGHTRPWSKQSLYEFVQKCGLKVEQVKSTRNWLRIPSDLIGTMFGVLARNRSKVVQHFWNIYGWNIFATGKKRN